MRYLTIQEVADMLRISVRTVRNYVADATLPKPFRLKRKPLWQLEDIQRALAESRGKAVPATQPSKRPRGRPRKLDV